MQKVFIGKVDETGHVFMLSADRKSLQPHVTGGFPFKIVPAFESYDIRSLNLSGLAKHGLRPLTEKEANAFFSGKDVNGNTVKAPREFWK